MRLAYLTVIFAWGAALAYGCSSDGETDVGSSATGAGAGSGQGGGSTGVGGGTGPGGNCTPGGTQCTDCINNDGDGWIDSWDTECIGPLDNDEGSFATGIPGDNVDPCKQDCFFDGNSGQGDDGCLWELKCDPENPGAPDCPYDPNAMNCPEVNQQCIDFCLELTPNGCDCFGCCEITLKDGSSVTILIGATGCTEETASDPTICKACTQVQDCLNPCDPCDYCLGKTVLPPECTPDGGTGGMGGGGGTGGCPADQLPCDPNTPCPPELYCLTGCCIDIPS
jgi:hypothetical protein